MENTSENKPMKHRKQITIGILAHVDAGKTTLSEALLYLSGNIRKAGRVDNGDAFLDTFALERERGITIFSKQAILKYKNLQLTLLDTPGHVDFSAEMERTLQVLDYAILVISGADGVQGHTRTLWRLLKKYQIPVFLFVNKMDQPETDQNALLEELKSKLDADCVDFTKTDTDEFYENTAMCEEQTLEYYLEKGTVRQEDVSRLISERKLFPCLFGSALKMQGVEELLSGISKYAVQPSYPGQFGAKVFKIARDEQGSRLTYLKITGGSLKIKQMLSGRGRSGQATDMGANQWEEKVNQIRIYSGEKYEVSDTVEAGMVCAVTGLTQTYPGEGLGCEASSGQPLLEPVLTYRIGLPEGVDAAQVLPKFSQLEEEEPELRIVWNETMQEIQAQLMGEVQMEILKSLIADRFGIDVTFDMGNIVYKETIRNKVEGVGHFEPLRHYAEVHLLLEPLEPGSGMQFAADCREEELDRNWQRLILTHLEEKEHAGVLTGAALTDIKITLAAGRAHPKHTEGGDFRQATYRAVRQGLMQAESVLLEPYYDFWLEVPEDMVGRAMTDIDRMYGTLSFAGEDGQGIGRNTDFAEAVLANQEFLQAGNEKNRMRILCGQAPASEMRDYQKEVIAYTRGHGRISCTLGGYQPCHNADEIVQQTGYDPDRDTLHPSSSVFCAHGAGFVVNWDQVKDYMHVESHFMQEQRKEEGPKPHKELPETGFSQKEEWIGTDEIDRILEQTYNANKRNKLASAKNGWKGKRHEHAEVTASPVTRTYKPKNLTEEYLLVDAYNIIYAWEELKSLAAVSMDGAKGKLLDILSNYQGIRGCHLIVVFDAYRVEGHKTETYRYHNIQVVYTKEAETADQYIEKFAHENGRKYRVTVATSDGLEQIIIRGAGCSLLSARDLEQEIIRENVQIQEVYQSKQEVSRKYLLDDVDREIRKAVEQAEAVEQTDVP